MLIPKSFFPLFLKFIKNSTNGKRTNKDGSRLKPQSINNYLYCLKLLNEFSHKKSFDLLVYHQKGENKREHNLLKKYYFSFYNQFTQFLYKDKNCQANYVGHNIKHLRTFFGWLNRDQGINTGDYYKSFFVNSNEKPILTISVAQLQFLLFDKVFEALLPSALKRSKDIFVLGCFTGLRYSDIISINVSNIEMRGNEQYLNIRSKKTEVESSVKLPAQITEIIGKYFKRNKLILPRLSLVCFNKNIKKIAELAGWTDPVYQSQQLSRVKTIRHPANVVPKRFCDLVSSHMMRRTSITIMLTCGMPEYVVRKISGHSANSKSFFRYVHVAQSLVDKEIEKMHSRFVLKT